MIKGIYILQRGNFRYLEAAGHSDKSSCLREYERSRRQNSTLRDMMELIKEEGKKEKEREGT